MAKTLSEGLRTRVIAAADAGMSRRATAERFGLAVAAQFDGCASSAGRAPLSAKPKAADQRSHRISAPALFQKTWPCL